jgi:hypothetical protein
MFGGHGQNYVSDTIAFAISLIPFSFIAALIVASLQEKRLRTRATVRERKGRS